MSDSQGKATVLLGAHERLGARLTEFGGWMMPLQYKGIIAEHQAVRGGCGVFDVSHLGKLLVEGERGGAALQEALTCDVVGLEPGRARYGLCLEPDGGCIDDVFTYRLSDDLWLVVPNASNVDAVAEAIREGGGDPRDAWDRWSILAVQGPRSFEAFLQVFPGSGAGELKLHRFSTLDVFGEEGLVARTGYTGERGFELYAPTETAEKAFEQLLGAGAEPCGLGARDTLRLEMGYALYGHELTRDIDPLEAGLGWAISWDTPFRGREALVRIKEHGPRRKLVGIRLTGRGVPRAGYEARTSEGARGVVTSGNFSPTLSTGIALALFEAGDAPPEGQEVVVEARGRELAGVIVAPPFIERGGTK